MPSIYNSKELIDRRRELRHNQTEAERFLWSKLRNRQLLGLKFFRQYSVDRYILDFYCSERRVSIELDGGQHANDQQSEHDQSRTAFLKSLDIVEIRFWNNEVMNNIDGVLMKIIATIEKNPS